MTWVFAILIVLALGGVALVAAGVGRPLGEEYGDRPDVPVPADRPLRAEDLRRIRFGVGLRGYRMDEVDALVARLAAELAERDHPGARADADATPDARPDARPDTRPDPGPAEVDR